MLSFAELRRTGTIASSYLLASFSSCCPNSLTAGNGTTPIDAAMKARGTGFSRSFVGVKQFCQVIFDQRLSHGSSCLYSVHSFYYVSPIPTFIPSSLRFPSAFLSCSHNYYTLVSHILKGQGQLLWH